MNRLLRWPWLSSVIVVACVSFGLLYSIRNRTKPESFLQADPPFMSSPTIDHGYTGWSVCTECHSRRVEEFRETRHFHALRLSDQMDFPEGFTPGSAPFIPAGSPKQFQARLSPEPSIVVSPVNPGAEQETVSSIAFIYGAGAGTDEVFFTRRNDELYELPVVWLHPQNCWGATQFDPHGTGDLSRPLSPQCLECHTVWVDYKRGSLNSYGPLESQLLGVTCERCHGPAKAHVLHHRTHPADTVPMHVVRPKTLSRDRQMDLCAQCHTNTVRHRRPPFSYRPGEPLEDSFLVLEMTYPEQNRVANQVRYLKESRCFQESETLTCITCHDPHRKKETNDPVSSSRSCFACHQPEKCSARSRIPEGVKDHCVNCHMPRRNKIQVNFEAADGDLHFPAPRYEHRVGIYPEAEKEVLLQWFATQTDAESQLRLEELGRALSEHWKQVGDSARESHRFLLAIDAFRLSLQFGDSLDVREALADVIAKKKRSKAIWFEGAFLKRERRLDEAIAAFTTLLTIEPTLAVAHLELGTLFAATGRSADAVKHLQLAIRYDGNEPGPHGMLGWLDYLNGKPSEALEHYQKAEKIEPWSDRIELMIGQCYVQLGQWEEAAHAFERALTIDPHQTEAARALRRILRERFSLNDALARLSVAVEITSGKQADLLLTLAEIYRDLKRIPEARKTIIETRRIAENHDPSLLPQIQTVEKLLKPR